ncbi:MAG TPA: nucleotidyltransferase [Planctomycetota bacterium]|nr:nucleotidyltransferase [Planctomycetota bacterium]
MARDFADFLVSLNSEGVAYVVIGGMAVLALVPYRTTRDLDVLIEPTLENAERTRRAVASWSGIEPKYSREDFISGDILSFGGLLRMEVHSNVPDAEWKGVRERSSVGDFQGVPTRFASLEDLIAVKEATGRPEKDLPDVRRLRKLQQRKRPRR